MGGNFSRACDELSAGERIILRAVKKRCIKTSLFCQKKSPSAKKAFSHLYSMKLDIVDTIGMPKTIFSYYIAKHIRILSETKLSSQLTKFEHEY